MPMVFSFRELRHPCPVLLFQAVFPITQADGMAAADGVVDDPDMPKLHPAAAFKGITAVDAAFEFRREFLENPKELICLGFADVGIDLHKVGKNAPFGRGKDAFQIVAPGLVVFQTLIFIAFLPFDIGNVPLAARCVLQTHAFQAEREKRVGICCHELLQKLFHRGVGWRQNLGLWLNNNGAVGFFDYFAETVLQNDVKSMVGKIAEQNVGQILLTKDLVGVKRIEYVGL